jgi:hypothetical protein
MNDFRLEDSLSAREESAGLGHSVTMFTLSAESPGSCDNSHNGCGHDGSVGFPVGWLGVPTSSWRPDFLGVTATNFVSFEAIIALFREKKAC